MGDKLRELLFPALVLSIVISLWTVGYAREAEEDVNRASPQPAELAQIIHHLQTRNAAEDRAAMDDPATVSQVP